MKMFTIFGELIIRLFDLIGTIILEIPRIPERLRGMNTENIRDKIDTEKIRENVGRIKNNVKIEDRISRPSEKETVELLINEKEKSSKSYELEISDSFTPEEKERTIFQLQIVSIAFLALSVFYLFHFMSFLIYCIVGVLLVSYILYLIFTRVKLMYSADFNAYRDFFLMYVVAGIILVLVGSNSNLVMAFSFQFFPSLTILIFAVVAVIAIFLIFRIKYHRNYTFGTVIETGKKTAYVKVDYDICSNVKPDIYIVENSYGADEGDTVKLKIEEKILNTGGNKPVSILETVE